MPTRRICFQAVFSFFLGCLVLAGGNAYALPSFMMRFSMDPFSRPELRNKCETCHESPKGGGPRNPFGEAFAANKHLVTPEFRHAWPDRFQQSITTNAVSTSGGEMKATILANGQDTILEIDGAQFRLNTQTAKLDKIEPQQAAKLAETPPPAPRVIPAGKLPLRDQPAFDHYLVNVPTALPYERHQLSMRFTHRFTQAVLGCEGSCAGIGELYGFDSFSYSSFGGSYGITRRLAATVYRSPLNKTIEMGGIFQFFRQRGAEPFSAAMQVSVEGRDNFQEDYTTNLVFPVSRSITKYGAIFVVPMVSFNANPSPLPRAPEVAEGETRKHQGAVGLGASIRFRPRTAFVMEWEPRVGGFRPQESRNTYSFGLQRTTNGHVFELTLSNTVATTTSRAVNTGGDEFSLGFNIYRRLTR